MVHAIRIILVFITYAALHPLLHDTFLQKVLMLLLLECVCTLIQYKTRTGSMWLVYNSHATEAIYLFSSLKLTFLLNKNKLARELKAPVFSHLYDWVFIFFCNHRFLSLTLFNIVVVFRWELIRCGEFVWNYSPEHLTALTECFLFFKLKLTLGVCETGLH